MFGALRQQPFFRPGCFFEVAEAVPQKVLRAGEGGCRLLGRVLMRVGPDGKQNEDCFWNTFIKGSLEEILPSYEKLRSVCAHVRDAKESRLTVACVGTLGAARFRRVCGACAAPTPVEIEA